MLARVTVIVSGHFLQAGRVGGAEHMVYNLVRGLWANGVDVTLLCARSSRIDAAFRNELAARGTPLVAAGSYGKRFIAEQASCFDRRLCADGILFPNYFTPPLLPARFGRVVTVIHDFQYRSFPELTPPLRRIWLHLAHRLTFARADKVIVPSEFVLRAVRRLHGRKAAAKTAVIPNPISWDRFEGGAVDAPPLGGQPYVLSVAAHYPHKNLAVLIRAFAALHPRFPETKLVLVGQLPAALMGVRDRADRLGGLIRETGLDGSIVTTGYIDDRALGALYRHASVFVLPSLFEGFGMPAVEALGFGVPTITTRCGALPEVTMGQAILVDRPADPREWADRLAAVLRAPARHRVAAASMTKIRRHYAPERVGAIYAQQLVST